MKFLLSWLKDYIDINASAAEIAKTLTSIGIEVDAVIPQSTGFDSIVVATVVEVQPHPNADKLQIATVSDGLEKYQVVCGAPNCRVGIKTAFAKVGATLYDRLGKAYKIKKSKIRDVESSGMLCSEDELLLSADSDGIIEFAEHIKEGADVAEIYGDLLFEVSLTPNLGHCMSIVGIAKELSAATEIPWRFPEIVLNEGSISTASKIHISIQEKEKAPRYCCRIIEGIKMSPSPEWMQKRLVASGIRPINGVVDVANYVALELGQPLHAFDYDKIQGAEIIVRSALEGELFTSLDSQERHLATGDLLVCDRMSDGSTRGIALAGIIGGANTEVNEGSSNVLIESAYFDPTCIRRTSKRLSLQTDASKRFERIADANLSPMALDRAVMLMHAIVGGEILSKSLDVSSKLFTAKNIKCRLARINAILGTNLSTSEVESVFVRLGFVSKWDAQGFFLVDVPVGRPDIGEEIDLIEEVARIYGYDNIPCTTPKYRSSLLPHVPIFLFEREVRARLLAEGLQEVMTCNLIGPTILKTIGQPLMAPEATIQVLNPTSIEQSILRTSLLPGLLQGAKYNYDRQNHDLAIFEIGRIHFKEKELCKEQTQLGILMMGKSAPHHWSTKNRECDFFDLKGLVEDALHCLGFEKPIFKSNNFPIFHSGRQLAIYIDTLEVGLIGELHPLIIDRLDVPQRILFAEINLHDLYQKKGAAKKIAELPIFPSSTRDWTVTLNKDCVIQHIFDRVNAFPSRFFEKMSLLDLYESEQLGSLRQNATFRFVYRDRDKTISQTDVDQEHGRIVGDVEQFIAIPK